MRRGRRAQAPRLVSPGSGERVRRKELNLVRRAIREGWPVTPDTRALTVLQLEELLGHLDARVRVNAARALIAAGVVNLQQARVALDLLRFETEQDLLARVKALEEEEEAGDVSGGEGGEAGGAATGEAPPPATADGVPD